MAYKNVKSLKYIFLNIIYTYMLTKLNYASDLDLRKSEIMLLTFTIFTVRRLQSSIYSCSIYYLVVECGMKILRLRKNFVRAVFFSCRVIGYRVSIRSQLTWDCIAGFNPDMTFRIKVSQDRSFGERFPSLGKVYLSFGG